MCVYVSCLSACLLVFLSACVLACLLACLPACLPACLLACVLVASFVLSFIRKFVLLRGITYMELETALPNAPAPTPEGLNNTHTQTIDMNRA